MIAALKLAWAAASDFWTAIPAPVRRVLLYAIAIAVAVLLLWIWHVAKVHEARSEGHAAGVAEAHAACVKVEAARRARQEASDQKAQGELEAMRTQLAQQQLDHQNELAAERARLATALAKAKTQEKAYVPDLVALDDAPRGYVLWRAATATFANGADLPDPPGAPGESLAGPSGVPLSAIADTDLAQAAAFRDTVTWGRAWQRYAFDVKEQCNQTLTILKGSP